MSIDIDDLTVKQIREIAAFAGGMIPVAAPPGMVTAERPVLVCTDKRGVFFGYATDTTGDRIILRRARMAVYWSADVKGVLGLAATGPTKGCKITAAPPAIELRGITAVVEVSEAAAKAWEAQPWAT